MKGLALLLIFSAAVGQSMADIDYERFEQNGKVGIKDEKGQVVLPASFDALGWSDGSFSMIGQITGYRQGTAWGLLNLKKELITKAIFQTLTYPGGSCVVASKNINFHTTKFGGVDLKGEVMIPFVYDDIQIHDLRAMVMVKNGTRYAYGLIDLNNRILLALDYKRITPLGTLRYAVQNFSEKTAVCSEEGKWVTDFSIDSLSTFQHDLAVVHSGLHQGLIDRTGAIRVEPAYREIRILQPGIVQCRKADAWKVIDFNRRELRHLEADELTSLSPNQNRVTLNARSGLVDSLFQPVIPMDYEYVGPIVNKQVVVRKNGRYGLLRINQSEILSLVFDSLIVEGHLVRARSKAGSTVTWDLYDTVGIKKTATPYERIGPYNGKFFPVRKKNFVGGIDRLGREQIACVYDSLLEVNNSFCAVKFKGQFGIIDVEDRWRLLPQNNRISLLPNDRFIEWQGTLKVVKDFEGRIIYFTEHPLTVFNDHLMEQLPDGTTKEINYQGQIVNRKAPPVIQAEQVSHESEGLTIIRRDGRFGFVDYRGRLRIANRYEDVGDFQEGVAPVKLLGKWGFIDKSDQLVVQPIFDRKPDFYQGVAQVHRNGQAGLIDLTGRELLSLRYDSIQRLNSGDFLIQKDSRVGLADARGNVLIEPRFEKLDIAGAAHVIVKQNGRFGLLTRDGLSVFPIRYDQLVYLPDAGTFFARQKFEWETVELK